MADTYVALGSIVFRDFEVPEKISFGGKQDLAVHKLVGGQRVVDALGSDDAELKWSGQFRGQDASLRARALDSMRRSGAEQILAWGGFFYRVVIQTFHADYHRFYDIPYTVSVVVIEDPTQDVPFAALATLDDVLSGDLVSMANLVAPGMPSTVSSAVTGLSSLASASSPLASISASAILPLQQSAGMAVSAVTSALTAQDGILTAAGAPLATILPGPGLAAAAMKQLGALQVQSGLADMKGFTGRVAANLNNFTG